MVLSVTHPTSSRSPTLSNDRQAPVEDRKGSPFVRSSPADSMGRSPGNHNGVVGFARPPLPHGMGQHGVGGLNRRGPSAAGVGAVPAFSDAQLNAMGGEILALYKEKVIGQNRRQLDFNSEGRQYSIRGCNPQAVLISTKNGVITLGPHGIPRSHYYNKIGAEDATLALMHTLATLRNHTPPARQQPMPRLVQMMAH